MQQYRCNKVIDLSNSNKSSSTPTADVASAKAVVWTPTVCTTVTLRPIHKHCDMLAFNVVNG
jgi:hypothetical protein